ncbi:MAG: hypothetical protein ACRBDX_10625 [Gammaproteobacteria bacterium]
MQYIIDRIVDVIMKGTRPFRILFFGGVFLGLLLMNIFARIFDVNTKLGGDINFSNIILIIISLFMGFGISYSIIHFADASQRKRSDR